MLERTTPSSALYAERGLHACLQALLPQSRVSEVHRRGVGGPITATVVGRALQVHDAWVQDEWSFCVTYNYAEHDGCLGFRACVLDHRLPGRYQWMYGRDLPIPPDPVTWGHETASLDIREPLGTVTDRLRYDEDGTGWWGDAPHISHQDPGPPVPR